MINTSTIHKILELIDDEHLVFIASVLGKGYLTQTEVRRLRQQGLLTSASEDLVQEAYMFGVYSGRLPAKAPEDIKLGEFVRFMGGTLPALSFEEKKAVEHAKRNLAVYIRGLGNAMSKKGHQILIDGDSKLRRTRMMQIRKVGSEGIDQRKTVRRIAQQLKELTQDQTRDWMRIVVTEVNNAVQEGRLASIIKAGGKDPMVFKRVRPDACPYCKLLYLKKDGVTPKVFRLSELINNGSNVGRKAGRPHHKHTGWKACVESTHPWCMCVLMHLPDGFSFDKHGNMTYVGMKKAS